MRSRLGLAQSIGGAAGDHVDLVCDVVREGLGQIEGARHAVDERQHVHRETRLQRGVLIELVEHHVRVGVALQADHETRLATRGVVLYAGDPVELAALDQVVDLLLDGLHRDLVGELAHHDAGVARALFDLGDRAEFDRTSARAVGVEDALATEDLGAGREVGTFDEGHEVVGRRLGVG